MALSPITTRIGDPVLLRALRHIEKELLARTTVAQFEYKDVNFNASANNDTIIPHSLTPATPEDVDYEVVRWNFASAPATAPVAYVDTSGSRRPWGQGYIVLRSNVANATATIRMSVRN